MSDPIRIAMWSGPRNISTAMMRSFENREDCAVSDEPFYAAYLVGTGIDHPMRAESIASQPNDWRDVVKQITGPVPGGKPIWYQKHMTHHMLPEFGRDWIANVRNVFLIRDPESVLSSYREKRAEVALEDIGFVQQAELFDRVADQLGHAPPVIAGADVLRAPHAAITALCKVLDIPFSERMLAWPAGKRASDGAWAPAWYDAVEKSTGFAEQSHPGRPPTLNREQEAIANAARPYYERLARHKLSVA